MLFDIATLNFIVWGLMAFITSASMLYTVFRKRDVDLDKRVRLLLLGMMITWFGNCLVPVEWFLNSGSMIASTILIVIGALINIQILLEWKFGPYIWLKVISIVLFLGVLGAAISLI